MQTSSVSLWVRLVAVLTFFVASCADDVDAPIEVPPAETQAAALYSPPAGYCEDTDESGVAYAPARPLWSSLDGPHYDGIVHPDGSQSIRYPDYEDISHNLAIQQTLQFLLSMLSNVTDRLEQAGTYIEEQQYVDDLLVSSFPQVDGHCLCIDGGCAPDAVFADVEDAVEDLLDVHQISDLLEDYLTQKVEATIADFEALLLYLQDLIDPSTGMTSVLAAALFDAVDQEIATATAAFDPAVTACDPGVLDPLVLEAAIEDAVTTELATLEAELQQDIQDIENLIDTAIALPGSAYNQLATDIEVLIGYFDGVSSFADLVQVDWIAFIATVEAMVPVYQDLAEDVQAVITDATAIWDDVSNYDDRLETLGDDLYNAVLAELSAYDASVAACMTAVQDALSYAGAWSPTDFADALTAALEDAINAIWEDAQTRIMQTWQHLEDRINGMPEDALAVFENHLNDARAEITSSIESCYMRGPRPECFDFCGASSATAQDDFLWLPVDFLQDPQALAAGAASGAMFALAQTGWLDQIVEWVDTNMGSVLGSAITSALGVVADIQEAVETAQEYLGVALEYVDRFTEGYHLGAYSELRPDLHMCVGYAGHGAYAQMGNLGGDHFSIGARYSSHNLSAANRVQFRTGGFAVSAFGYDLSLAPGVELNTQLNGWRLWDQTRPFGIPLNVNLNADSVARLDVFNVVPMDQYPFGMAENVPVGAFLVRDLFPSRPTPVAAPEWPRLGVDADWEDESTAVISLGLNLPLDFGPYQLDLPTILIYPGVTVTPYFGYAFGVGWQHETNLMRARVQEMINANLPSADHLDTSDFNRDMHAMQAPDLSADNGTYAYVEPELGLEAFVGFNVWKIRFGIAAGLGLSVNIRPGGFGGIVDLNAALADALVNSNPPAEAPCEPVWDLTTTYGCNNQIFEDSTGDYSCTPPNDGHACCLQIDVVGATPGNYQACIDDWTGITEEICGELIGGDETVAELVETLEGLPGFLDFATGPILDVLAHARRVTVNGTWGPGSCDEGRCDDPERETLVSTASLNVTAQTECQRHGYCTYEDGSMVHDVLEDDCFGAGQRFVDVDYGYSAQQWCGILDDGRLYCEGGDTPPTGTFSRVDVGTDGACGIRTDGTLVCWGAEPLTAVPAGTYADVTTKHQWACAAEADRGMVRCWGSHPDGAAVEQFPFGDTVIRRIESTEYNGGFDILCGLDDVGAVVCTDIVRPELFRPIDGRGFTDVSIGTWRAICAVASDGQLVCVDRQGSCRAITEPPRGTFVSVTHHGLDGACALDVDGHVTCWGCDERTGTPDPEARFTDFSSNTGWAGVLEDGRVMWQTGTSTRTTEEPTSATWSPYACTPSTHAEVAGWEGSGCHPLQHGYMSACGCADDTHCGSGEVCDTEAGQCVATDGSALSCVCGPGDVCGGGRTCVDGACVTGCAVDGDCAPGRVCDAGFCQPPHGIPTAEEIAWGMTNVEAPMHAISSYAMSELMATLLLRFDLSVEASFKLFGKERTWRLFEFNRAWDLGSTWKGWYQPGLEALYQSECESPALDEPMTNRFPRSLTSNPYDDAFDAAGVSALRHCDNGGVCRYNDPLPASETDPADYAYGNVGEVGDFIDWCLADMPEHRENPDPSTNDDLVSSVVDTAEWGQNIGLDLWANQQVCVAGVPWNEWTQSLEPTFDAEGNLIDVGNLGAMDCHYDDPVTGDSWTFPCAEITEHMMAIWGCLDPTAGFYGPHLADVFPSLVVTDPVTGDPVFDLDQMFTPVAVNDPTAGVVLTFPYDLDNMIPSIRFATTPFPMIITLLGQHWLEEAAACFDARFDAPEENACTCTTDADCDAEYGEACNDGVCEQAVIYTPDGTCVNDDCSPSWMPKMCPIVYIDLEPGPCCGDGIVQEGDTYTEECDAGPDGDATCSASCEWIDTTEAGACCAGDGVCYENLGAEGCADEGGTFNPDATCESLDYCEEAGQAGACCLASGCVEHLTDEACADAGGIAHPGQTCDAIDACEGPVDEGACCYADGCADDIQASVCEANGGIAHPGATCAELDGCGMTEPERGACCMDGACHEQLEEERCLDNGGVFTPGAMCVDVPCGSEPELGACCIDGLCLEDLDEEKCLDNGGVFSPGDMCMDVPCGEPVTGACCDAEGCRDGVESDACGGEWHEGETCEALNFCEAPEPLGVCCLRDRCIERITAAECEDRRGRWYDQPECTDGLCGGGEDVGVDVGSDITEADASVDPAPVGNDGGRCSVGPQGGARGGTLLVFLAVLGLIRRRRV